MVKKRLIPTLLVRHGRIIQSRGFRHTNVIGNAFTAVDFFNAWAVDEIIILDISPDQEFRPRFMEIVEGLSKRCFVPLTVGGWVRDRRDIRDLLNCGADKVCINSRALECPEFITEAAATFGSQCVVISMDVRGTTAADWQVYGGHGRQASGLHPVAWARRVEELGAGEIYLTSIDRDGGMRGYDLDLLRAVADAVHIPVIASGGAGSWQHMVDAIVHGHAEAVSAANIFHYTEHSTKKAKDFLLDAGVDMRPTFFYRVNQPREVRYEVSYRV